jgi:glycosyltransferase involved in cell wall biosynthesis
MNILIYDPATPFTYTYDSLHQRALRGTESTILRVANVLKNTHQISIAQRHRPCTEDQTVDGINYLSFETAHGLSPDVVILLRYHRLLDTIVKHFPHARHFFWLHNMPPRDLYKYRDLLLQYHYQIIAVSHFHKNMIEKRLKGKWYQRLFRKQDKSVIPVKVLYNPIEDDLNPNDTPVNQQQMIFTSSPYKGLGETLRLFTALSHHFPDYELLIVSPDKLEKNLTLPKQARFLQPLPPRLLAQHIRESFCVFYPQTERVETFGLVYAEANALGTPVLAHDFGAAREVLSDTSQLINGHDINTIINKITQWREKRPVPSAKPEFRLSRVMETWSSLLTKAC